MSIETRALLTMYTVLLFKEFSNYHYYVIMCGFATCLQLSWSCVPR